MAAADRRVINSPAALAFLPAAEAVGECSPAREAQGTSFLPQLHLAQPSGFINPPKLPMGGRAGKENSAPAQRGRRPRSALPRHSLCPGEEPSQRFPKRSTRQAGAGARCGEGGGAVGGEGAAQLCSRALMNGAFVLGCCSAVTTSTSSEGGRKGASSAPPALPDPGSLLSGPPVRAGTSSSTTSSSSGSSHVAKEPFSGCGVGPTPRCGGPWEQQEARHGCPFRAHVSLKRINTDFPPDPAHRDVKSQGKSFPTSHRDNSRGKEGDFQVVFNLHLQNSGPIKGSFG